MNLLKAIVMFLMLFSSFTLWAQEESQGMLWSALRGLDYRIKAGFNIGGTSPVPLPAEIREVKSYKPGMQIAIEGNVIKWFDRKWGTLLGMRLENKGMRTDARVKNYHLVMDSKDNGHLEGAWTGYVKTKVKNSYITIPIQGIYKVSPRWDLKLGPYLSFLISRDFSGSAYDGYIREGGPTGEKIIIENEEATYDFSNDQRKFQWGIDAGGEWKAYKHLSVYADLTWGLNSIFRKNFESISFDMYCIYLNFGFGYVF